MANSQLFFHKIDSISKYSPLHTIHTGVSSSFKDTGLDHCFHIPSICIHMLCLNFWGSYLFFLFSFAWDTFPHQLLQFASASPLVVALPGLHVLSNYEPPAMERFPRTSVASVNPAASGVLSFQRSQKIIIISASQITKNRKSTWVHMVLALVSCFCYNGNNLINTRALTP